jgi:hypothetical protein
MPLQVVAEFRKFVENEGQAFLERIDAWLTEHENESDDSQAKTLRLGVGAYLIESQIEPDA